MLNAGFDQIQNLISPQVYATGDILDTFIYRIAMLDAQFGPATAMSMFKSVVSCFFISVSYYIAYKFLIIVFLERGAMNMTGKNKNRIKSSWRSKLFL